MSGFETILLRSKKGKAKPMPRNVKDIIAKLPEARRKEIMDAADAMYVEEMTLAELRQARVGSQVKLARRLGIEQAALSRLERRSDMHISRLKKLIAGMGGTMTIVAKFPDHAPIRVNLFDALGRPLGIRRGIPVRIRGKGSVTEPAKAKNALQTKKHRAKAPAS
jgi:transcriptional regulator with XRE-family HTH domain